MARALGLDDQYIVDLPGGETMYHLRLVHYPPQLSGERPRIRDRSPHDRSSRPEKENR